MGADHWIIDGVMEEGVEIPAWDNIKSQWSGAGINASYPRRDYHRWVMLQPSPPVSLHQEAAIIDGSYHHLAQQVEDHWCLKLEDGISGPG